MTQTSDSLRETVREFVIQSFLFGHGDSLKDGQSFLEAGIIDSTGVLELVGFLENTFDITVADGDLVPANLDSIDRVVDYLARKFNERESPIAG